MIKTPLTLGYVLNAPMFTLPADIVLTGSIYNKTISVGVGIKHYCYNPYHTTKQTQPLQAQTSNKQNILEYTCQHD